MSTSQLTHGEQSSPVSSNNGKPSDMDEDKQEGKVIVEHRPGPKRRLQPGVFIDGIDEKMPELQVWHKLVNLVPSLKGGKASSKKLGNGGYALRHPNAHDLIQRNSDEQIKVRPMTSDYFLGIVFAPTGIPNHAFKAIDGLIYARRWRKNGKPLRGVTLFFESEVALAYAVRDGLYLEGLMTVEPSKPRRLKKEFFENWRNQETARLLSLVKNGPLQGSSISKDEQDFRARSEVSRALAQTHVTLNSTWKKSRKNHHATTRTSGMSYSQVISQKKFPQENNSSSVSKRQRNENDNALQRIEELLSRLCDKLESLENRVATLEQSKQPNDEVIANKLEKVDHGLEMIKARIDLLEDDEDKDTENKCQMNTAAPSTPKYKNYTCGTCQVQFESDHNFAEHWLTKHGFCQYCNTNFSNAKDAEEHFKMYHRRFICQAQACRKLIVGLTHFKEHNSKHTPIDFEGSYKTQEGHGARQ